MTHASNSDESKGRGPGGRDAGARPGSGDDLPIDRPRLTPQGRTDPNAAGEDATQPGAPGAKPGQPDKAEG